MSPKPALAFLHSLKALYPRPIPRKRVSQRDGVESSRGGRSQRQSLLLDIFSGIKFVFQSIHQNVVLAWRWQVGNDVVGLSVFLFDTFATLLPIILSIPPLKETFCAPSRAYRS